jgi:hypothetical protein
MTKVYELGYTISVGGETEETILKEFGEDQLPKMGADAAKANVIEQGPNIRGVLTPSHTVWWVREKPEKKENFDKWPRKSQRALLMVAAMSIENEKTTRILKGEK